MKLVQHLASSCLFEQMEGHLVRVEQTGSSWGGVCIPTFIQRFKAAFLHPTSPVPMMTLDQTQGSPVNTTITTRSSLQYPDSYTTMLWTVSAMPDIRFYNFVISDPEKKDWFELTLTLGKFPLLCWCFLSATVDGQQRSVVCTLLSFRPRRCERYQQCPTQSKLLEADCPVPMVQPFCCSL